MYTKYYENYDRAKMETRIREYLRKNQIDYQLTEYFPNENITLDFYVPLFDTKLVRVTLYQNNINVDGHTQRNEDFVGMLIESFIGDISNV